MSRKPGEGPPAGGCRPSASGGSAFARRTAIISFIHVADVCQPLAVSVPQGPFFAASGSMWKYCGSYFLAKAMISSSVNVWLPSSIRVPIFTSSNQGIASLLYRRAGIAPAIHRPAIRSDDHLVVLVQHFNVKLGEPHFRAAFRGAALRAGAANAQRITHIDGLAPAHFIHARRTHRGTFKNIAVTHHAHHHRAGMPPARAKPAENGLPPGFLIEMKGLRVELACESDDLFLRHVLVAELNRLADAEIFPV